MSPLWKSWRVYIGVFMGWADPKPGQARFGRAWAFNLSPINKWTELGLRAKRLMPGPNKIYTQLNINLPQKSKKL